MTDNKLTLTLLPGIVAICRLDANSGIPSWAYADDFFSITHTDHELSIVCPQENVPAGIRREDGYRCFKVKGPLDFALTGIIASLLMVLAQVGVSVFALSTFDTDYLLVKQEQTKTAIMALSEAGHHVIH